MSLENTSLEKILDEYQRIRQENEVLYNTRLEKTYSEHPELKKADEDIAELLLKKAFSEMKKESGEEVKAQLDAAYAKRDELIGTLGADPSYSERIYTCPYCHDTGYIEKEDGPAEKCRCFRKRESEALLKDSGMQSLLKNNNFGCMREDIFEGEVREHFLRAVSICKEYINSFDEGCRNILFCGTVGTGKSFLSCCIAGELLESYHSVIYMSAKSLFDELGKAQFSKENEPAAVALKERIYGCDLLIIDDLGTELTNSFVATELFTIINERANAAKSVIISTNLELAQIRDRYSDRIFSRLAGSYDIIKLDGPDLRTVIK